MRPVPGQPRLTTEGPRFRVEVAVAVWFFTQLVAILILSIVLSAADEAHTPVALRPPWVTAVS